MITFWANHATDPPLNDRLCEFVSKRIWGGIRPFPQSTTMAVVDDTDTVVAVMVFYDYDAAAGVIQISGAADTPRWLTRPILRQMFAFPFDELGCQAVAMRVDPDDRRLHRILKAYGFEMTRLRRLRGRDRDECLFVLYDDVWRANRFNDREKP